MLSDCQRHIELKLTFSIFGKREDGDDKRFLGDECVKPSVTKEPAQEFHRFLSHASLVGIVVDENNAKTGSPVDSFEVERAPRQTMPGNRELIWVLSRVEQHTLFWLVGVNEPGHRVTLDFALFL